MTIDLANIPYKPVGCVNTKIGELCVFSISWGSIKELHKELDKPIEECEPDKFIRKFTRYICFPKTYIKEDRNKPAKPLLSDDDILSLTDDDLEAIAKVYIENNEYLFKKEIVKEDKKPDQVTVVSFEYGEIEYPKKENENYIQYLFRLYITHLQKMSKGISETISSIMPDIKSFSSALTDGIKNTLLWGNSLSKTMEQFRAASMIPAKPAEPVIPIISVKPAELLPGFDFAEVERNIEANRLKPFSELADRLDQLIDASAQTTEFMIEANKIQTGIAEEIKSAGDETRKFSDETRGFSKQNIKLTYIVIILAVFGIVASFFSILKANNDGEMQRVQTRDSVNLLAGKLTDINNSIAGANDSLKIENERLKEQTAKQAKMIDEMKIIIGHQGKKLEELEKRN